MKKLFLGLVLSFHSIVLGQSPVSQDIPIQPIAKIKKTFDVQLDQKSIRQCAAFFVSKKLIRSVNDFLHRSVGPTKKLLKDIFVHCDFHKNQLEEMKICMNEFIVLLDLSAPIAARMVFLSLSHPQMEQFVQILGDVDDDSAIQPFFDCMDNMESYLTEQSPQMYTSWMNQRIKWQQFNDRWQGFMTSLADYVSTRFKLRQKYIEKSVSLFNRSMIWKHVGPVIGLGVQAAWNTRKLMGHDNGDDIMLALIQEMYAQVVNKREIFEQELVSLAHKAIHDYGTMCCQLVDGSMRQCG